MLSTPPDLDLGIWARCGFPGIQTTNESSEKGFASLKGFRGLCGFGGILGTYKFGDFDYCDYQVNYDNSPDIAGTFGGVSGGGLWQIPLRKGSDQIIEPKEYILSGVVFYQALRTSVYRTIKCHGPKRIYEIAQRELKRGSS